MTPANHSMIALRPSLRTANRFSPHMAVWTDT